MFASTMSSICSGICLSVFSLFLFRSILPGSVGSRSSWFRRMLRTSFYLYASILSRLRPLLANLLEIDLLLPIPRTMGSMALSVGIGWAALALLGLNMPLWVAVVLLAHGGFVGWSWEGLVRPDDFQFGMRLE